MENLVYAELSNQVTFEMLEDRKLIMISDTGVFLITTEENCRKYSDQTWMPTDMATVEEYWDMYPKVVAEVRQW